MIHKLHNFFSGLVIMLVAVVVVLAGSGWVMTTSAQTASKSDHASANQQPLYSEYRGVRIGMSAVDARAKLGEPFQKSDDLDWYVFSERETAQVAYDTARKVKAVSVDYLGGVGAPDYKLVVGPDVEVQENGTIYKMVRYESLGFWVSYNRTAGAVPIVSITIQRNLENR